MIPFYQAKNEEFTLYNGDTRELIRNINKKVDMIFADPPYFLSKNMVVCIMVLGNLLKRENGIELLH